MGINITEIAQKVLNVTSNAANIFRKMYDLYYNPKPLDVPFEYIDENGNKITTNIKNVAGFRKKLWDDVGAALGQFNRSFYVDQENGDDNNDGSRDNPFKTLSKAITATPIGGQVTINLLSDYTLEQDIYISKRYVKINVKNGIKLKTSWYVATSSGNARLYFIDISNGFLHIHLEQYDKNGEPSQLIIPENDTGKDKEKEFIGFIKNSSGGGGKLRIDYRNKVDGAVVIDVQDGYLFKQYNWARENSFIDVRIQGHYAESKIRVNTDNNALLAYLRQTTTAFTFQVDNNTLIDQDGNDLDIIDVVTGIVKDSNGVPRNIISNIVF